jgi:hypothetical protein
MTFKQKIHRATLILATALMMVVPNALSVGIASVAAATPPPNCKSNPPDPSCANAPGACNGNDVASGLNNGAATATNDTTKAACGDDTGDTDNNTIASLAKKIINIVSLIVGATAVLFVVIGGFRYITSGGDSGKVSSAKQTIIYALIGLAVAALAQFLVHYVINTAINSTAPPPKKPGT